MDVYLDGEPLSGAGTTLSSILDAARERVGADRLIVEAYADGAAIPEGDLAEPPQKDPYAAEIKLISADTNRLIQGPLVQASEAVSAMREQHVVIAERLQTGEVQGAMSDLEDVLETWMTAKTVLELAAQLKGAEIAGSASSVTDALEKLTSALVATKEALTNQDWSGLADALEFDMEPMAGEWSDILRTAAENVSG